MLFCKSDFSFGNVFTEGLMKKHFYLDCLRAFATLAVILWHTVSNVFDRFGPLGEWLPASITFGPLVRWSVPVFFMISGALLLGKEEEPAAFYKKRFTRICIPVIVWVIIYGLVKYYHFTIYSPPRPSFFRYVIVDNFALFFTNKLSYHFYFISLILGLYLLSPFLSKMIRLLTKSQLELLLLMGICAHSIRIFVPDLFLADNFQLGGQLIYFVLGYYLFTYPPAAKIRLIIYGLAFCSAVLIVWLSYRVQYIGGVRQDLFYNTLGIFIYLISTGVFLFFQHTITETAAVPRFQLFRRFILFLSANSFGFFLAHPLIINILLYSNFRFYTLTTGSLVTNIGGKETVFPMNHTVGAYFLALLVFLILCPIFYVIQKLKLSKYFT